MSWFILPEQVELQHLRLLLPLRPQPEHKTPFFFLGGKDPPCLRSLIGSFHRMQICGADWPRLNQRSHRMHVVAWPWIRRVLKDDVCVQFRWDHEQPLPGMWHDLRGNLKRCQESCASFCREYVFPWWSLLRTSRQQPGRSLRLAFLLPYAMFLEPSWHSSHQWQFSNIKVSTVKLTD